MEETQSPGAALAAMRKKIEITCESCGDRRTVTPRTDQVHHYCDKPACRYKGWIAANDGKRPPTKKPRGPRAAHESAEPSR